MVEVDTVSLSKINMLIQTFLIPDQSCFLIFGSGKSFFVFSQFNVN